MAPIDYLIARAIRRGAIARGEIVFIHEAELRPASRLIGWWAAVCCALDAVRKASL